MNNKKWWYLYNYQWIRANSDPEQPEWFATLTHTARLAFESFRNKEADFSGWINREREERFNLLRGGKCVTYLTKLKGMEQANECLECLSEGGSRIESEEYDVSWDDELQCDKLTINYLWVCSYCDNSWDQTIVVKLSPDNVISNEVPRGVE